ncbi:MAG: sulfatase-like hydrolase/transferase, partial [Rubrobacter sp.]|nr:sulfatase-like hydrolase/transferase [Rubrobacter sp.]
APDYYTKKYREGYAGEQIYPAYGDWERAGLTRDDVDLGHDTYCGEVTMVDFWIGRLLAKLDALGLRDNTIVLFTSDHGFYFGEHGYFGKAEWVHDPEASISDNSLLPEWLAESWLLTFERSPLYRELTNVPMMIRGPGLAPGRRQALTTAVDIAPTIMEMVGLGGLPTTMVGESFGGVLSGQREEHRPFVISSWPLYLAEGEVTTAVDSKVRRISSYMPITVTTSDRSLVLGGPDDEPELYDLNKYPGETHNVWKEYNGEGSTLCEDAISFLETIGTPEEHVAPRREALNRWWRGAIHK